MHSAVTELPVNCPDFNNAYEVDITTGTYAFAQPDFQHINVTLLPGVEYYPHGDYFNVTFSIEDGSNLTVGSHDLTTTILDTELHKNCISTLTVRGLQT